MLTSIGGGSAFVQFREVTGGDAVTRAMVGTSTPLVTGGTGQKFAPTQTNGTNITVAGFTTPAALSVNGNIAALATGVEHSLVNNWYNQNTLSICNQSNDACFSDTRFLDRAGYEMGGIGYGNQATGLSGGTVADNNNFPWFGSMFIETGNPSVAGQPQEIITKDVAGNTYGGATVVPFRIIQSGIIQGTFGFYMRTEWTQDGNFNVYPVNGYVHATRSPAFQVTHDGKTNVNGLFSVNYVGNLVPAIVKNGGGDVLAIQNSAGTGAVASIVFNDYTGVAKGAVSYGNTGLSGATAALSNGFNIELFPPAGSNVTIPFNITQAQNTPSFNFVTRFSCTSNGNIVLNTPNAAPANSELTFNNSRLCWVDETNNLLKFLVKYSTGTVKTGSIALS